MAHRSQVRRSRPGLRRPPRRLATLVDSILASATRSTMHRSSVPQPWDDPASGRVLAPNATIRVAAPLDELPRARARTASRCGGRPPNRTRVPKSRPSDPANLTRNAGWMARRCDPLRLGACYREHHSGRTDRRLRVRLDHCAATPERRSRHARMHRAEHRLCDLPSTRDRRRAYRGQRQRGHPDPSPRRCDGATPSRCR
jgi:hypothetical protein